MYRNHTLPRREVDNQGRQVQFPHLRGIQFLFYTCVVASILMLLLGVLSLPSEIWGAVCGGIFMLVFGWSALMVRSMMSQVWYYEDEYGFEMVTGVGFFGKTVSASYDDIASWSFYYHGSKLPSRLDLKTCKRKKSLISLNQYRPVMLLDALLRMEKEGRFGEYGSRKRCEAIENELRSQVNAVREEMRKTGAHIDISKWWR